MDSNRILEHPILEFDEGESVAFTFDGQELVGKSGDTIASALHAAGVRVLGARVRVAFIVRLETVPHV